MAAIQGEHGEYRFYDTHNLYGLSESKPTMLAVHESTGKRGFVVSRSTYPSSNKYAAHWHGDNYASWEELHQSIIAMLEFSLYGYSFVSTSCIIFQRLI